MGSWRSLASSVGAKVKTISKGGYDTVSSKVAAWRGTEGETWTQWRERRREESKGTEKVALFPGFAVKRHRGQQEPGAFDLDVYVDGYASSLRSPELASRSQKAFMRIAKGFAALPRLPELQGGSEAVNDEPIGDEGQYLDLSSLPPPPDAITEETERLALEHRYRNTERGQAEPQDDSAVTTLGLSHAELARLHANLDARLQPFWSSILSNRSVRVSLFAKPPPPTQPSDQNPFADPEDDDTDRPLAVQELSTSLQGYFSHRFTIPFEELCTHPHALDIAFNRDPTNEHPIHVVAELVSAAMTQSVSQTRQSYPKPDTYSTPQNNLGVPTANSKLYSSSIASTSSTSFSLPPVAAIDIPITSAAVRLISDIDDTVKVAEVLKGVKTIFQNVFVKSLEELVIPGMGEWYTSLSQKGVRFHYVV
ncbi:hypothetical protein FRC03_003495 [Tulasnella sp. 419]|nr:hypothetical protein FRC03_003495 [Tulasnella sp. 419]